jgi:hypothetical protein
MTNCILTEAIPALNGYGKYITVNGKSYKAHRGAWIKAYGPIPKGKVIDHMCHNEAVQRGECEGGITCVHRACINPKHLRLVTQQKNIMAGLHNIDNRSHCRQGHPFIKENIMVRQSGKRECAECNRVRARAVWANRKKVSA